MRIILDTNILLSGHISTSGTPAELIDAWDERRFILVSHRIQLDELRDVTRRAHVRPLIKASEAGRLVNRIRDQAEMPEALASIERSPDPRDDFLLALCVAGAADWLVTGDKDDLLALGRHGPTNIVTAARMAVELGIDNDRPARV